MRFLNQRIKFSIYLLKSEVDQEDYINIYESDMIEPSEFSQINNKEITPVDIGDDDPSQGDSWLFTFTYSTSDEGLKSWFYQIFDSKGNSGTISQIYEEFICLKPAQPTLRNHVLEDGDLTFNFSQNSAT